MTTKNKMMMSSFVVRHNADKHYLLHNWECDEIMISVSWFSLDIFEIYIVNLQYTGWIKFSEILAAMFPRLLDEYGRQGHDRVNRFRVVMAEEQLLSSQKSQSVAA